MPRQHELRIEILFPRTVVDYGNPTWGTGSPLTHPFVLEHSKRHILKGVRLQRHVHFGTASALRPCKKGVEERPPGVGIDLDQSGAVFAKMEIVAHQGTNRAVIMPRDFRCPRQDLGPVGHEPGRRFDSCHHLLHLGHFAGRDEHRHV